ncbi:MAG: hypothetical protein ACI4I5_10650 [Acutalibacteraceae bacterium]
MKKILAVLLAVLTVFSFSGMLAYAEDVTEPETETTEEVVTYSTYEICQDTDFSTLKYLEAGNDVATLLKPGDQIISYKTTKSKGVTVFYYPDVDARPKGKWEPADANNIAFSPSAVEYVRDVCPGNQPGVIRDIDFTDFTIAYSEDNTFVGWVVTDFNATANSISCYAVWEKNHKLNTSEDVDDLYYIVDFFYSIRKAISEPIMKAIKAVCNAILYVKAWLYDVIFNGEKA